VQQFESRQSPYPRGVILSGAVFQAERRISRADPAARPEKLHARSLTRLNCAGFGMTPSKDSPSKTAINSKQHAKKKARIDPGFVLI
jgi:hypothetical protein